MLASCAQRTETRAPPASTTAAVPRGATGAASKLALYLRGAEIQAETDVQRAELRRALHDLLDQPAAYLRSARYAGFDGTPAQRSLVQVLKGHVVPEQPTALDVDELIAGREQSDARAALRATIEQIGLPR